MLLGMDPSANPEESLPVKDPQVTFAYMKHMWKNGNNEKVSKYFDVIFINFLGYISFTPFKTVNTISFC